MRGRSAPRSDSLLMQITTMIGLVTLIPLIFTGIWALVDFTRILKWIEASKEEARRSATAILFGSSGTIARRFACGEIRSSGAA